MEKLQIANLTEQIDSISDVREAVNYLFNKHMIKDLYRNYGTSQRKYLLELDKNKPKIILLLDGLEKREKLTKEKENITVGKEFIW